MAKRDTLTKLDRPTHVPLATVPSVLWGDEDSGFVNDLFYVLSDQMVVVTVTLPPGASFSSSDVYRPYYDTQECLYVLRGAYTCQDPTSGEVRTARQGEILFMQERQWHYGHNFGTEDLHLLEVICPPADSKKLKDHPRPDKALPFDSEALQDWPARLGAEHHRVSQIGRDQQIEALIGDENPLHFDVFASTDKIFFANGSIGSGQRSDVFSFPFDTAYHVEDGMLHVSDIDGGAYFQAGSLDCVFLPANCRHRLFSHDAAGVQFNIGGAGPMNQVVVG